MAPSRASAPASCRPSSSGRSVSPTGRSADAPPAVGETTIASISRLAPRQIATTPAQLAASAQARNDCALGFETGRARHIIDRPEHSGGLRIVDPGLDRDDALARRRDAVVVREPDGYARFVAEPHEAGHGQHQRVVLPGIQLSQARIDVSANREEPRVSICLAELRAPAHAAGADSRLRSQRLQPIAQDERVARILPRQHRRHREALG
jgi:hypothetical protein